MTARDVATRADAHRILPHYWAGAFTCWGHDNREAPVRVATSYLAVRCSEWTAYSAGDAAFEQQGHFEKY